MKLRYLLVLLLLATVSCVDVKIEDKNQVVEDHQSIKEKWYSSPKLAVMTGFIYPPKSEFSIQEWDKDLGNQFNAEQFVSELKTCGIDYLIYSDKWIDGFVFHDTQTTAYKSGHDFIRDISGACHKYDLRIIIYWNAIADGNPDFEQWAHKDSLGNNLVFAPLWPTKHGNLNSPMKQIVLKQLEEIVTQYGRIDGIWLDIFSEPHEGRNPEILQAFEQQFNEPMLTATEEHIKEFYNRTRLDHLRDIRTIVNRYQEDCVLCINDCLSEVIDSDNIYGDYLDYYVFEGMSDERIEQTGIMTQLSSKPTETGPSLSNWFTSLENTPPKASFTDSQVIVKAALALCQGSSIWLAIAPGHNGVYGDDLEQVKKVGKWYSKIRPYLQNPDPIADVAVVLNGSNSELLTENDFWKKSNFKQLSALEEVVGMVENLNAAGVLSHILYKSENFSTWPKDLTKYKFIILPERVILDYSHSTKLKSYVEQGGRILSFGHATCLDVTGAKRMDPSFSDVFGVQFKQIFAEQPVISVPLKGEVQDAFGVNQFDINQNVRFVSVGSNTNILAEYKIQQWMFGHEYLPFLIENQFGKGKSLYLPCSEAAFRDSPEFWTGMVKLLRGSPVFEFEQENTFGRSKWPDPGERILSRYLTVLNKTEEGIVLHIIDHKAESTKVTFTIDSSVLPEINDVTRVEGKKYIEYSKEKGKLKITTLCNPVATLLLK